MGFLEVLTIVFIGLKLTGFIDWGWLAVFSPMLIAFTLYFVFLIGFIIVSLKSGNKVKRSFKGKYFR